MVMVNLLQPVQWLYHEFGIASVYHTGRDAWLVIFTRSSRMFAFGGTSLIIALFFSSLHFSDSHIGLFMTLTLAGDVVLSSFLTLVADGVGRRRILFAGACLMVLSGAVFAFVENFWVLLIAAVLGVISATGGDFGPFRAIEESTLSHLTTPKTRSDVLSWYIAGSILGSAAGTEFTGRVVESLQHRDGWTVNDAYHAVFWLYVVTGLLGMLLTLCMSDKCEVAVVPIETETEASEGLLGEAQRNNDPMGEDGEQGVSYSSPAPREKPMAQQNRWRIAQISTETQTIMYKLWFLLAVDSLADGMVSYSLTNYYLDEKFHLPKSTLGDIISASYFIASSSTIFASPLARHLGLINTMVFTHLPSSLGVLLFPFPRGVVLTIILFFIRTGLNNMDQAPRSAFIAAVVKPEERTAVMGITSMLRTLASTAGPSLTGFLAESDQFWIAFVAAGSLRVCYDLGLFVMFVNIKLYSHEKEQISDQRRSIDEAELTDLQPVERNELTAEFTDDAANYRQPVSL